MTSTRPPIACSPLTLRGRRGRSVGGTAEFWLKACLSLQAAVTCQNERVKQLPPGIPPANSAKWHSRRWWDGLGYTRARSLTNPSWQRDVHWLIQVAVGQQPHMPAEEQAHYNAILATLRRYPRTANGTLDADAAWDEVLATIDELSLDRHARHLAAVKAVRLPPNRGGLLYAASGSRTRVVS